VGVWVCVCECECDALVAEYIVHSTRV